MAYVINGPVIVGDDGKATTLRGIVSLENVSVNQGDLFFVNSSGNLEKLPPGQPGQYLKSGGENEDPYWQDAIVPYVGFSSSKNSDQTGISDTPATVSDWTLIHSDLSGDFNVLTGVYTAPEDGLYEIDLLLSFSDGVIAGERIVEILVGGASTVARKNMQPNPDITIKNSLSLSVKISLSQSDTVEVRLHSTSSLSNMTVYQNPESFLSVTKIN